MKNGVIFGEFSTALLFGKWNSWLCNYIRAPILTRIPWINFKFILRETLKKSHRLHPIDFFENLGRSRSLIYWRKNLKKISRTATVYGLKPTKFHWHISNDSRFPPHSTNSSKKNWVRPCSPAPIQKKLEKLPGVGEGNVLKSTEFRRFVSNCFWNIRLSIFRGFPLFQKIVKLNFPENWGKKSRFRLDYVLSWFSLLWLAEILSRFTSMCSLEVVGQFGYILGTKFSKIPQKYSYGWKKIKLLRPIEVDEKSEPNVYGSVIYHRSWGIRTQNFWFRGFFLPIVSITFFLNRPGAADGVPPLWQEVGTKSYRRLRRKFDSKFRPMV